MVDWVFIGIQTLSIVLSVGAMLLVFIFLNKLAAKREKKRVDMYACPICGGVNLIHEKKGPRDTYFIASLRSNNYFTCVDCNYEGVCPLILKSDIEKFRKDLKSKKNNTKKKVDKN